MSNIDSIKSKPPGKGINSIPAEPFRPKPKIKQSLTLPVSPTPKIEATIPIPERSQLPATQEPAIQEAPLNNEEEVKPNEQPATQGPTIQEPVIREPTWQGAAKQKNLPLSEDAGNSEQSETHTDDNNQKGAKNNGTNQHRPKTQHFAAENLTRRPTQTTGSFFMLNQVESFKLIQELDPFEFKLFHFLNLRAWGWDGLLKQKGDGTTRASVGYICQGTNLKKTMVENKLKTLLETHLIQLIELSFKKGNLYRVSNILHFSGKIKDPATQGPAQQDPANNAASPLPDEELAPCQTGRNIYSRFLDLSLSKFLKSFQLAELEARWISFMKKEREREEKGLLKLFQQKPEEAELILKAFQIILKEQDEYGEIKSAISVLETNYTSQYRTKALAAIARQQQKEKENQTSVETERKEEQDTEAKLQMIRMQCFQEAFPDMTARKEYVLTTCKTNPMFTNFGFNSPIAVSYAVGHWATHEGTNQVLAALDQQTQN